MIFEAPRKLSNMHILQKLQAYGETPRPEHIHAPI